MGEEGLLLGDSTHSNVSILLMRNIISESHIVCGDLEKCDTCFPGADNPKETI